MAPGMGRIWNPSRRGTFLFLLCFFVLSAASSPPPRDPIAFAGPPVALGTLTASSEGFDDGSSGPGNSEAEAEDQKWPLNHLFDASVSSKMSDGDVRITVEEDAQHVIEFESRARHVTNVVAQLLEHRYDPSVSPYNCYGLFVNVEVRPKYTVSRKGMSDNPFTPRDEDGSTESAWGLFWNSTAALLDSSAFCYILPTVMMRVDPTEDTRSYYFIVRTRRGRSVGFFNGTCEMRVFLQQSLVDRERRAQNIFAFALPLLFLMLTAPYILWRIDLVPSYLADIDIIEWMWFLPRALRDVMIGAVVAACTAVMNIAQQRRAQRLQTALAEQHQRITNTNTATAAHAAVQEEETRTTEENGTIERMGTAEGIEFDREAAVVSIETAEQQKLLSRKPGADHAFLHTGKTTGTHNENNPGENKNNNNNNNNNDEDEDEEEEERICRICRDGEESERLVSACKCTGSVRWVHRGCLDHWRIESAKRNVQNVNHCEICKKPFCIGIRRRTLLWQSSQQIVRGAVLFVAVMYVFSTVAITTHATIGEASCLSPWRSVAYRTMFDLDGIFLTLYAYFMFTLLAAFSFVSVFSRWHTRPETEIYVRQFQTLPVFWTRGNTAQVAATYLIALGHALSFGYLVKLFFYRTSNVVWNWEASPSVGGMAYISFLVLCTKGMRYARGRVAQWRWQRGEAAVDNVVVEGDEPRGNGPHTAQSSQQQQQQQQQQPQQQQQDAHEEGERQHEEQREQGSGYALRPIRATEHCPRRPVL